MIPFSFTATEILLSLAQFSGNQVAAPAHHIIIHPGIVDHIDQDRVFVRILSQSACATCHAKGACSVAEVEEKIVEVQLPGQHQYRAGEQVTVRMKQSLGIKAVFLGYILPLLILVLSIIIFLALFDNEGLAAILSLLLLVPYYLILYMLRDNMKQVFNFSIYPDE